MNHVSKFFITIVCDDGAKVQYKLFELEAEVTKITLILLNFR